MWTLGWGGKEGREKKSEGRRKEEKQSEGKKEIRMKSRHNGSRKKSMDGKK